MKAHRGLEVQLHSFLTSAVNKVIGQLDAPSSCSQERTAQPTEWKVTCVCSLADFCHDVRGSVKYSMTRLVEKVRLQQSDNQSVGRYRALGWFGRIMVMFTLMGQCCTRYFYFFNCGTRVKWLAICLCSSHYGQKRGRSEVQMSG